MIMPESAGECNLIFLSYFKNGYYVTFPRLRRELDSSHRHYSRSEIAALCIEDLNLLRKRQAQKYGHVALVSSNLGS